MERLKFLSPDRAVVFKFEGYGRFGSEIRERANVLSEAGYVASSIGTLDGFGCYPFLKGTILSQTDLNREVLDRMAEYCAFRAGQFRAPDPPDSSEIRSMVQFNVAEEFGVELNGQLAPLEGKRHVLVDGRMLPHEWIRTQDGRLMKCDATAHGDDHFFPGPSTDICWDLAGAIIEWQMSPDGTQRFIDRYRSLSGDDPGLRLPAFLLAYAVFRMAYCKMAAAAMQASGEETRLQDSYLRYRAAAKMLLP
jgi:hypothetical protein